MDDRQHLGANLGQDVTQLIQIENAAPGNVEPGYVGAGALGDFVDTRAEEALDASDDLVARFEQVDQARFHAGHACGADRKGQAVLRLKRRLEHFLRFVHQRQELRVEVPHQRRGHHA